MTATTTISLVRVDPSLTYRHSKSGPATLSSFMTPSQSKPRYVSVPLNNPSFPTATTTPIREPIESTSTMPRPSKADGGSPPKKKKRQRKPKDLKPSLDRQSSGTVSDSPAPRPSPEGISSGQTTPKSPAPSTPTAPSTPGKAYAGPTFNHSPAASSLPVPKFFSSKPTPTRQTQGLQALMDEEDNSTTDGSQTSTSPAFGFGGGLEQLFKAHREEQARIARSTATDSSDSDSAPDSFARDIFGMDSDSPIRAAFSPSRNLPTRPPTERSTPKLLPPMSKSSSADQRALAQDSDRLSKSAALRELLLQQPGVSPTSSPSSSPRRFVVTPQGSPAHQRQPSRPMNLGRPPHYRLSQQSRTVPTCAPVAPAPQYAGIFEARYDSMPCKTESRDYSEMENRMRRMLNIASPTHASGVMI